jgi:D-arabinitol 2-dehydrogenase
LERFSFSQFAIAYIMFRTAARLRLQRYIASTLHKKNFRPFTTTNIRFKDSSNSDDNSRASGHGRNARTDQSVKVEYPENIHPIEPVRGHGGPHFKPTLASFSLEGRVAVVTGGARGLGLVMAHALATSGANVALVDLNSMILKSRGQ